MITATAIRTRPATITSRAIQVQRGRTVWVSTPLFSSVIGFFSPFTPPGGPRGRPLTPRPFPGSGLGTTDPARNHRSVIGAGYRPAGLGTGARVHHHSHRPCLSGPGLERAVRRLAVPRLGRRRLPDARGGGRMAPARGPTAPLARRLAAAHQRRH